MTSIRINKQKVEFVMLENVGAWTRADQQHVRSGTCTASRKIYDRDTIAGLILFTSLTETT